MVLCFVLKSEWLACLCNTVLKFWKMHIWSLNLTLIYEYVKVWCAMTQSHARSRYSLTHWEHLRQGSRFTICWWQDRQTELDRKHWTEENNVSHHLILQRLSMLTSLREETFLTAGKTRHIRTVSSPADIQPYLGARCQGLRGCMTKVWVKACQLMTSRQGRECKRQRATCSCCSRLSIWRHGKVHSTPGMSFERTYFGQVGCFPQV